MSGLFALTAGKQDFTVASYEDSVETHKASSNAKVSAKQMHVRDYEIAGDLGRTLGNKLAFAKRVLYVVSSLDYENDHNKSRIMFFHVKHTSLSRFTFSAHRLFISLFALCEIYEGYIKRIEKLHTMMGMMLLLQQLNY